MFVCRFRQEIRQQIKEANPGVKIRESDLLQLGAAKWRKFQTTFPQVLAYVA